MQIKELMLEAVKRGELIEFLCGKEAYKIELSQYVPGILPTDVLFDEKHKIATFQLDIAELILELQKALKEKKEELMNEIIFTDGIVKKEAWKDIVRWNNVCKIKYGVEFIPKE